jgi:hypothetical protein
VFDSGHHAILLQEGQGHGTLKTFHSAKLRNNRQCELRECLVPMKSALSKTFPFFLPTNETNEQTNKEQDKTRHKNQRLKENRNS